MVLHLEAAVRAGIGVPPIMVPRALPRPKGDNAIQPHACTAEK